MLIDFSTLGQAGWWEGFGTEILGSFLENKVKAKAT